MVLDFEKLKTCRYVDFHNKNELNQIIKVLIFRAILGIPDICQRNFAFHDNKVFSLDEEQINYFPFTMKFSNEFINLIRNELLNNEYKVIYNNFINKLEKFDLTLLFGRKIEIKKECNLLKLLGIE